ncbi:MAG TPA: chemotaxis protein CheW [Kofleriaceae bacterium]|nr:chemotaxis protein CheW [Kofleriaceae bacterium]
MTDRAAELRAAFDRGFAEPVRGPRGATRDVLRVRVGGQPHAIELAEVAALHVDRRVVALPTRARELLGVVAIRGAILPVYDLRAVLGLDPAGPPRWVIALAAAAVAVALDGFEGLVRTAAAPIARGEGRFVRGALALDGAMLPVIDLAAVASTLARRWTKEP